MKLNDVNSYMLAKIVSLDFQKTILPTEIKMLNIIGNGVVTKEKLSEWSDLDKDLIDRVISNMKKKDMIEKEQFGWKASIEGEKIINFCKNNIDLVNKEIEGDSRLKEIADFTETNEKRHIIY